jgi:hypothetical protein
MTNEGGWSQTPQQELVKGSPEWLAERDRILAAWEKAKVDLEKAKADEMDRRKEFVKFAFDNEKLSGTERIPLSNGYEAKAVKKLNFKFVSDVEGVEALDALDAALTEIENVGPEGKFVAERLVRWSADLSLTEYKLLEKGGEFGVKVKSIIDRVIETTEGAPTLEIIPPKDKRK